MYFDSTQAKAQMEATSSILSCIFLNFILKFVFHKLKEFGLWRFGFGGFASIELVLLFWH